MRMSIESYKAIQKFSKDLEGVFTLPDLKVILDEQTEITLFRAVRKLVESGDLIKIKRSFYATPDASLAAIKQPVQNAGGPTSEFYLIWTTLSILLYYLKITTGDTL